jgi:hypothetical protein
MIGCVALLALIAGTVSCLHMHMLVAQHGQPGCVALTPLSVGRLEPFAWCRGWRLSWPHCDKPAWTRMSKPDQAANRPHRRPSNPPSSRGPGKAGSLGHTRLGAADQQLVLVESFV